MDLFVLNVEKTPDFGLGKNYAKFVLENHGSLEFNDDKLLKLNYRLFDERWTYFDNKVIWRWREKVMKQMTKDNTAICFCRQLISNAFSHVFLSNCITDDSYLSNKSRERGYCAPLYIYHDDGTRTANFQPAALKQLTRNLRGGYEPENILDYIYATLHSPKYREKYKEFLKTDFPRIVIPADDDIFRSMVGFGCQLRELHLMKSPLLDTYDTTFPVPGTDKVDTVNYKDGNVWINGTQYFGNVPEGAWSFSMGGYQPAQKWLKDRRGHRLTDGEMGHYQKIIKILVETQKLMDQIDAT